MNRKMILDQVPVIGGLGGVRVEDRKTGKQVDKIEDGRKTEILNN